MLLCLLNCLSIVGLIFAAIFIRIKDHRQEANNLLSQLKQKGYVWKRRVALVLLIIDIPFLFFSIFFAIELLDSFFRYLGDDFRFYHIDHLIMPFLLLVILPIAVLVFLLIIKRIKKADRPLFEKLSQYDYSRWTLLPKDARKFVFMPVFSVVFVILSFAISALIGKMF